MRATRVALGDECVQGRPGIASALHRPAKWQDHPQVVNYITGVGTAFGQRVSGGAFGVGLFANVLDCYRFLVLNYDPGDPANNFPADQLYFFGFSRGAYTVRSLAGMIRNSGILRRGHEEAEKIAVEIYRDYSPETAPDAESFGEVPARAFLFSGD